MSNQYQQHFAAFESEGETQIRIRLAAGEFGVKDILFGAALEWLRLKDEERNEARPLIHFSTCATGGNYRDCRSNHRCRVYY